MGLLFCVRDILSDFRHLFNQQNFFIQSHSVLGFFVQFWTPRPGRCGFAVSPIGVNLGILPAFCSRYYKHATPTGFKGPWRRFL